MLQDTDATALYDEERAKGDTISTEEQYVNNTKHVTGEDVEEMMLPEI